MSDTRIEKGFDMGPPPSPNFHENQTVGECMRLMDEGENRLLTTCHNRRRECAAARWLRFALAASITIILVVAIGGWYVGERDDTRARDIEQNAAICANKEARLYFQTRIEKRLENIDRKLDNLISHQNKRGLQ